MKKKIHFTLLQVLNSIYHQILPSLTFFCGFSSPASLPRWMGSAIHAMPWFISLKKCYKTQSLNPTRNFFSLCLSWWNYELGKIRRDAFAIYKAPVLKHNKDRQKTAVLRFWPSLLICRTYVLLFSRLDLMWDSEKYYSAQTTDMKFQGCLSCKYR